MPINLFPYLHVLSSIGRYMTMIGEVLFVSIKKPPHWNLISRQLYEMGVQSLPVVTLTGFSTGLVLATQSFFQLQDKGLASTTGILLGKAMTTELGPILTSFMLAGRVGAAMCATIGTMKVTEQIDALITMATNPMRYLIAPRFIAGAIMGPLLTIYGVLMGIFGGYLMAVFFFKMPANNYFDPMSTYLDPFDIFMGLFKGFVFSIIIVTICCYKGMTTKGGASGVGNSTTNSVVICYVIILFFNFIITMGLNLMRSEIERFLL